MKQQVFCRQKKESMFGCKETQCALMVPLRFILPPFSLPTFLQPFLCTPSGSQPITCIDKEITEKQPMHLFIRVERRGLNQCPKDSQQASAPSMLLLVPHHKVIFSSFLTFEFGRRFDSVPLHGVKCRPQANTKTVRSCKHW